MEQKDLKNLMIVELRNGNKYVVVEDLLLSHEGMMRINQYNQDLKIKNWNYEWDIIKVYDVIKAWGMGVEWNLTTNKDLKLIWERPKELLTKEEKEWLQAVIKPFKDKILVITYTSDGIEIELEDGDICILPQYHNLPFKISRLERDTEYTLKKLGLED